MPKEVPWHANVFETRARAFLNTHMSRADLKIMLFRIGTGQRGHYERGLFTGEISRTSRISRVSRISRKWSDSPLFSTVWGSLKSLEYGEFGGGGARPLLKAFSPKKGLVFAVSGASAPPPSPTPAPSPPPTLSRGRRRGFYWKSQGGVFQEREGGGGPGACTGNFGGGGGEAHLPRKRAPFSAKTPFCREKEAPLRRKRLLPDCNSDFWSVTPTFGL